MESAGDDLHGWSFRVHTKDVVGVAPRGGARDTRGSSRGSNGQIERIVFVDGTSVNCRALFFSVGQQQRCDLPRRLGCIFNKKGTVMTGRYESTNIRGLYVAGDASRDVQLAIVAAAEGAEAAFAINTALIQEDRRAP